MNKSATVSAGGMLSSAPAKTLTWDAASKGEFSLAKYFRVYDIATLLTLALSIYLTFAHMGYFQYSILTKVILVAAVWPRFRRSFFMWLIVVAIWIPTLVSDWCKHEDHVYMATYWCAAMAMATLLPAKIELANWYEQAESTLRRSARLLLGLCFMFAVLWKVFSPQFHDGSLFHYKLTCDDRFSDTLARFPGGMETGPLMANYQQLAELKAPAATIDSIPLQFSDQISWLAWGMTGWTIFIEGLIAIAFLFAFARPDNRRAIFLGNVSLIGFALTTYVIAPVMGFGFLFMIMGYMGCAAKDTRMRNAFLATLVILGLTLVFRDHVFPTQIHEFHQSLK